MKPPGDMAATASRASTSARSRLPCATYSRAKIASAHARQPGNMALVLAGVSSPRAIAIACSPYATDSAGRPFQRASVLEIERFEFLAFAPHRVRHLQRAPVIFCRFDPRIMAHRLIFRLREIFDRPLCIASRIKMPCKYWREFIPLFWIQLFQRLADKPMQALPQCAARIAIHRVANCVSRVRHRFTRQMAYSLPRHLAR